MAPLSLHYGIYAADNSQASSWTFWMAFASLQIIVTAKSISSQRTFSHDIILSMNAAMMYLAMLVTHSKKGMIYIETGNKETALYMA